MQSFTRLWEKALSELEDFYTKNNNGIIFTTYVRQLMPEFENHDTYYFKVTNEYYKEQLNTRFYHDIYSIFQSVCDSESENPHSIAIKIVTPKELDEILLEIDEESRDNDGNNISLNPYHTFDTFVVGNSNKLAHAACVAVADAPGMSYNPLFIYGGVGLGKTHLMHAIGNEIIRKNRNAKVLYVTSETFTSEYVDAIQKKRYDSFRNKYRTVDVLLIDDIQFISRAKETQTELFHTFNTLREHQKQIIFSSDKPPSEIPSIEERLLNRFNWGFLTDIGAPDYETRVAILKSKVPYIKDLTKCDFQIDDAILHYIASKENTNIRDLEGALTRVVARAKLLNSDSSGTYIDLSVAEEALKDFFTEPVVKAITPNHIIRTVCSYYEVTENDLKGERRNREIAIPRQITMYLLRTLTDVSYMDIGELLGGKNHTTVMHGQKKIADLVKKDIEIKNAVNDIIQKIREN